MAALGIETSEDISLLHYEDLNVTGLKPVQSRKLLKLLQDSATGNAKASGPLIQGENNSSEHEPEPKP